MGCQKLTYKKENFRVIKKDKDPGPPICDDVFCNTGGDINSGTLPENDIYFFHPDHLGSTSYITNIAGETVQFNTYMPFGESFVSQQRFGIVSQYTFLSKEKDLETGLHYLSARYYNSQLSVFLSVDPLWEQTVDPYGYAYRNPIKYIDPSGMSPDDIIINGKGDNGETVELARIITDQVKITFNTDIKVDSKTESNKIKLTKEQEQNAAGVDAIALSITGEAAFKFGLQGDATFVGVVSGKDKGQYGVSLGVNALAGVEGSVSVPTSFYFANDLDNFGLEDLAGVEMGVQGGTYGVSASGFRGVKYDIQNPLYKNNQGNTMLQSPIKETEVYTGFSFGGSGGPLPADGSAYIGISGFIYTSKK